MFHICLYHEGAHFGAVLTIFHIFRPICNILRPSVQARRMDQWTEYGMLFMHILPMIIPRQIYLDQGPIQARDSELPPNDPIVLVLIMKQTFVLQMQQCMYVEET